MAQNPFRLTTLLNLSCFISWQEASAPISQKPDQSNSTDQFIQKPENQRSSLQWQEALAQYQAPLSDFSSSADILNRPSAITPSLAGFPSEGFDDPLHLPGNRDSTSFYSHNDLCSIPTPAEVLLISSFSQIS